MNKLNPLLASFFTRWSLALLFLPALVHAEPLSVSVVCGLIKHSREDGCSEAYWQGYTINVDGAAAGFKLNSITPDGHENFACYRDHKPRVTSEPWVKQEQQQQCQCQQYPQQWTRVDYSFDWPTEGAYTIETLRSNIDRILPNSFRRDKYSITSDCTMTLNGQQQQQQQQ